MPTQGEVIRDLTERLERQIVIEELEHIKSMDELQEYIKQLKEKTDN